MQAQNSVAGFNPTVPASSQDTSHSPRHRSADSNNNSAFPAMHRHPTQLPDPWLFDSEALLRELDRCRELMLNVPIGTDRNATHFAVNIAIDAIWNLSQHLRYLLHLHREGQRAFAAKADPQCQSLAVPVINKTSKRRYRA
jgi:hypothetical protein